MSAEKSRGRRPDASPTAKTAALGRSREMGQWSFLTWSFFLSQVLSAEQFVAGAAAANEANPESGPEQGYPDAQSRTNSTNPAANGIGHHGDDATGALATVLGSNPGNVPVLNFGGAAALTNGGVSAHASFGSDAASADKPILLSGALLNTAALPSDGDADQHDRWEGTGLPQVLAPLGFDPGGEELNLGHVLAPVLAIVGDVAVSLPPVAAALELSLQTVGGVTDIAGGILQTVATDLSTVTEPLLGTALPKAVDVLTGGTANIGGVLHSTSDLLHEPLAGPIGSPAMQGPVGSIGPNILASGGTLAFPDLPAGVHGAIDTLFSPLGGYTDYSLSLQNIGHGANGTTPAIPTAGNLFSALLDHLTHDAQPDGTTPHGHTSGLALPSALDELHLRGLGDGITA